MGKLIKRTNFTIVSNDVIMNQELSFKAKGVYSYLCSRQDGWQFRVAEIVSRSKDGKDSVQSGLKELEDTGYLKRTNKRNKHGKFDCDWVI